MINCIDDQIQNVRNKFVDQLTDEDWQQIQSEILRLSSLGKIIKLQLQLHGHYKEEQLLLQREVFGLYRQWEAKEYEENEKVYAGVDRRRVS